MRESFSGKNNSNSSLQYLARCAASTRKAELSEVPAAQSGYYARKGRTNPALWTFPAAPASVSVSAAGRTSPGLWRRQVKCMQMRNLLMGSLRLNAANGLCHPVCVPAVRDGPGTWDDSAVLRPADGRSNPQTKEAPAPVAQRLMINSLESFQLLFLALTSLSISSRKAVVSFTNQISPFHFHSREQNYAWNNYVCQPQTWREKKSLQWSFSDLHNIHHHPKPSWMSSIT